jgi:hypothetical protein
MKRGKSTIISVNRKVSLNLNAGLYNYDDDDDDSVR